MKKEINISSEQIYDILCECGLYDVYHTEGWDRWTETVLEENNIMEDFIPEVIDYINENLENIKLILI